ncbi:hypothetical protein ACS0TY_009307 [Phlomoides rotata]
MNFHPLIASSPNHSRTYNPPSLQRFHQQEANFFKPKIFNSALFGRGFNFPQIRRQKQSQIWEISESKKKKFLTVNLKNDPAKNPKKKGSIAGAVALIIGTSIGSGILALPQKTSPAGLVPSSITMTLCWAFLLIEALLLVEINVSLQRKKKKKVDDKDLEVMSIRTMAQETLGEWGGALATVTYVFLGYTSVIAYCSKSGEILHHLTDIPGSVSGIFFTLFFTVLVSVGGARATDQVNQWLTASMIGLLVSIEVLAVVFGGWSGFEGDGDWNKVPETLPIMIFALVYHDIAPVVCAYLEGDLARIRASVVLGSVVPLLALLVWDAIALGLSNQADQVSDPVELLLRVNWGGIPFMVEAFSLLAVGTSLIGTLLSFSEFFKEQLNNMSSDFPSARLFEKSNLLYLMNRWWEKNKTSITATAMVIAPSLVISTTIPDAFSAATDFAGGYCMTMLYGVLPPIMAWAVNKKEEEGQETSITGPALVGVGLFASGIVAEQIFHDFSPLLP